MLRAYSRDFVSAGVRRHKQADLFCRGRQYPSPGRQDSPEIEPIRLRSAYSVPWKGTIPQWVRIPLRKLSLQPVATGADDGGNDIVRSTSVEQVAFVVMRPSNPSWLRSNPPHIAAIRIRLDNSPRTRGGRGQLRDSDVCSQRGVRAFDHGRPQWSLPHTCRRTSTTSGIRPIQ